jgi:hypothetical protein
MGRTIGWSRESDSEGRIALQIICKHVSIIQGAGLIIQKKAGQWSKPAGLLC